MKSFLLVLRQASLFLLLLQGGLCYFHLVDKTGKKKKDIYIYIYRYILELYLETEYLGYHATTH